MDSRSGRTSVVVCVISLVAKGKLRQRDSKALPKLQIIRLLSKRSKRRAGGRKRGVFLNDKLGLHAEGDLADAAFRFQVNRCWGFAISVVGVGIAVVF